MCIECKYSGRCVRYKSGSCNRCKNNTGKRDYFEDDGRYGWRYWYPIYPYPYYWSEPVITCSAIATTGSNNDYFISYTQNI